MAGKFYSFGLPSLAAALVASVCVLFQWWLPLLAIIVGAPLLLFLVSEPAKALILWLLASPMLSSYIKLPLPAGVPDVTLDRLFVGCILLALLLRVIFRARRPLPIGQTEKAILLFIIVGLLDILFRSERKGSDFLIFFDEYGIPFLLFVAAKDLFHSNDDIKSLVRVFFLLGLYLALYGIYQFLNHGSLITDYDNDPEMLGHLLEGRAVGPFQNAAVYGTVLIFAFVWTLYLIQFERWALTKFFVIIGLGLMGLGIFLSFTRAVWVGFLASLFTVQAVDRTWRKAIALCMGALLLLSSLAWLTASETSQIKGRAGATETVYQRLVSYRAALLMSLAKPVFGYGRGEEPFVAGRAEYLAKVDSAWVGAAADMGPPHNQYLYTLVQYGLLGLVLYGAVFFLLIQSGLSFMRMFPDSASPQRQFVVLFWGMLVTYLVQGLFADVAAFPFLTSLLFVFAGVLEGLRLRSVSLNGVAAAGAR